MCSNAQVTLRWERYRQTTSSSFFLVKRNAGVSVLIRHCAGFYTPSPQDVLEIKLMHTLVKLLKVCWIDWWEHFVVCVTLYILFIIWLAKSPWFLLRCGIICPQIQIELTCNDYGALVMHHKVFCWHVTPRKGKILDPELWFYYIIFSGLPLALGVHVFVCGHFSFVTSIYPPTLWFKSRKEVNEFFNCSLTPSTQNQLSHLICRFTFSVHCLN